MLFWVPMRNHVIFSLNGDRREADASHAQMMVADYLRLRAGLPGTKIVCAEGDCGACTVLVARSGERAFAPINACIYRVAQLDGCVAVTVDALAVEKSLHPVQQAMLGCHGSQCGYCTPGFVMAITGLVEKRLAEERIADPIEEQAAKNALTGNLCRCTGYRPILEAVGSLTLKKCPSLAERFLTSATLRALRAACAKPLHIETPEFAWYAPRTLRDGARWLRRHPEAALWAGGSDLGVTHNKRKRRVMAVLSLQAAPGLDEVQMRPRGRVRVGARVTLTELRHALREKSPEFASFLDLFASPQIKNVATLAGNVANASPIADTPPFLLVSNAMVEVEGARGRRTVPIEEFFLGYRKTALARGELIRAIEFDLPAPADLLRLYKVSQRKDLDISTVSAALRFRRDRKDPSRVAEAKIAYGGVAATPARFPRTEKLFRGAQVDAALIARAQSSLQAEMKPIGDLRGSAAFRRVVASRLLERFLVEWGSAR